MPVLNLPEVANNEEWRRGPLSLVDPENNGPLALPAGTTVRMQLRASAGDLDAKLELSIGSGLIVDAEDSQVSISVPVARMRDIAAGSYAYDIVVTQPTGRAIRVFWGTVPIAQGVTR